MTDRLKADVLSAFNGGELTPELSGRIDKEELKFGTRYVSNFLPTHQGGLKKWYGTSKIATITANVANGYRMIPFDGASEPLALLFCNDDVYAVSANEVYKQSFKFYINQISNADYQQINDLIYFANQNNKPFQIKYDGIVNGHHKFELVNPDIKEEPFFPVGWNGNYNKGIQTDGYQGVVTVTTTNNYAGYSLKLPDMLENMVVSSGVFDYNVIFSNNPKFGITGGNNTCVTPTIGETKIQLVRVRNGVESVILTSSIGKARWYGDRYQDPNIAPPSNWRTSFVFVKEITTDEIINAFSAISATDIIDNYLIFDSLPSGHASGDLYKIRLSQGSSYVTNMSLPVEPNTLGYTRFRTANSYVVDSVAAEPSVVNDAFDSVNVIGRKIKVWVQPSHVVESWAANVNVEAGTIYFSDGNYYLCLGNGTTGNIPPTHREGIRSDGNINFQYLHSGFGFATVISVLDSTHMVVKVDGSLPITDSVEVTHNFEAFQWSMWGYHNRYPSKVFTYSNRLGYILDTDGYGTWLQMSKTDSYNDFGTEEYGKQLDTSAINTVISGHSDNRINWVLSGYRLYMGSVSGEYNVQGDKSTGSLTPTNVNILPVSNVGSAQVDAIKYKDMNIFVGASGEDLYRLTYDYSSDDYVPEDLSSVSERIFDEGVAKLQVLRSKDRNLYFLTNNNKLRLCSVQEEIKTVGCYRVDVAGDVLDFATSNAGTASSEFLLVKRGNIYTMELVDSAQSTYMLGTRKILRINTDPVISSTITDAELADKEIFVQNHETGAFYHTVVNHDGTFKNKFSTHSLYYGLPMVSEVHTLPPYNQNNKLEGAQQKAIKFNVRLYESGEFSYGSSNDFDKWYEYHNWNTQAGQEWGAQHKLMSGDLQLPAPFGYMQVNNPADGKYPNTTGVAINLRSSSPEPFNLLMVSNLYV